MRTLALVLPQGNEYCRGIRSGVIEGLEREAGWQLLELVYHADGRDPAGGGLESIDAVIGWLERSHSWVERLLAAGTTVVNCGGDWRGVPGVVTLAVDARSVLRLALRHFVDLSLERVVFFGQEVSRGGLRQPLMDELAAQAREFGIEVGSLDWLGEPPTLDLGSVLSPVTQHDLRQRLLGLKRPCGLFCEDDHYARLACAVAGAAGLRVPADLAVLGAGDNLIGRFGSPTISTVCLPGEEVGHEALRRVVGRAAGRRPGECDGKFEARRLIVRESTGGRLRDIAIERLRRHIERKAPLGLTMQELPEIAGVSLKVLRRRYFEAYGEEPSGHIRRLRLTEARRRLAGTTEPVVDIAAACGFSSQAAFYNYFRRHCGMGPLDFRAQARPVAGADHGS